jgi:hypothetical protein
MPHCLRSVPVRPTVERGATASSKYSHNPQRSSQISKGLRFYSDNKPHQIGESVNNSVKNSGVHEISRNHSPQPTAYTPPPISPKIQNLLIALAKADTEQKALVAAAAVLSTLGPKNEKEIYSVSAHTSLYKPNNR